MNVNDKLKSNIKKDSELIEKADKERPTLLAQTVHLGTVGIMLVLPIVGGAYLGSWLDKNIQGYSFSWTISMIVTGVFVGSFNVYFFIRSTE